MIKALTGTVFSRGMIAVLNLLIIALAGRLLGAEAVGTISLIVLGITIIMLVNNFVGGGAITYLISKYAARTLIIPAYIWAVFTAVLGYGLVHLFDLVPSGFEVHVVTLAFIQSVYTVHLAILLGKQKLALYNVLSAIQVLLLFVVFAVLLHTQVEATISDYVTATYVAFLFTLISSFIAVSSFLKDPAINKESVLARMITQGGYIQLANVFQLLVYRFNYYLIQRFVGIAPLGVFSVGTQLAEGSWMIPKSIGTVLYMKVANEREERMRTLTTIGLMHLAWLAAGVVLLILWLIPNTGYQFIFGEEISGIPRVIRYLSPGILTMAGAQALSHYFSGVGANHHNTIASGIAMAITLMLGFTLIPEMGLSGAAITASVAYSCLFAYQLIAFKRHARVPLSELLPRTSSVQLIKDLLST